MTVALDDDALLAFRQRLEAYTTGAEALPSFQRWFTREILGTIDELTDDRANQDLVRQVGLRLFEVTDGVWTDAELRREFRRLLLVTAPSVPVRAAS